MTRHWVREEKGKVKGFGVGERERWELLATIGGEREAWISLESFEKRAQRALTTRAASVTTYIISSEFTKSLIHRVKTMYLLMTFDLVFPQTG